MTHIRPENPYRLRILAYAGLSLFAFAASASAVIDETINSVTLETSDTIIDADADNPSAIFNRNFTRATVSASYDRNTGGAAQTETYRYAIQLLGNSDLPVQLDDGAGGSATTVYQEFDVTWTTGLVTKVQDTALSIQPDAALDLNQQYRWKVTLQHEAAANTFSTQDDAFSGYRRYWHFTGTNPIGGKRNVLTRIRTINFTRRYALLTAEAAEDRGFEAEVEFEVRRYDGWEAITPITHDIEFKLDSRLLVSGSNAVIALDPESDETLEALVAIPQYVGGGLRPEPYEDVLTQSLTLIPSAQIDTASDDFYVQADFSHIEVVGNAYVIDEADRAGFNKRLLHFSGVLLSDEETATITALDAGSDASDTVDGDHLITLPVISGGFIDGKPNFTISTDGGVTVHLFDDGHAEIEGATGVDVTAPLPLFDLGSVNGIRFQRQNITLDADSARADVTLILPTGLGYYDQNPAATPPRCYEGTIGPVRLRLDQALAPQSPTLNLTPAETYIFVEESKPLEFIAESAVWDVAAGQIRLNPPPAWFGRAVRYNRKLELNAIAASPLAAEDKEVFSNDLYLAELDPDTPTDAVFGAGPLGSSMLRVEVTIEPNDIKTHFPYGAEIAWDGTGTLRIIDDKTVAAASSISGAQPIAVPWARDCILPPDADCDPIGDATAKLDPDSAELRFTADGGLAAAGVMILQGSRRDVVMGYIDALSDSEDTVYAHDSAIFDRGSFLSAGQYFSVGETLLFIDPDSSPGVLLNSGFNPNNLSNAERPGQNSYRVGNGDYPGVNYRVADEADGTNAVSTLGGLESPVYALNDRSKFYVRQGGVSGILEPTENPFPAPVFIYGYEFTFSRFGLSFLSSEVHQSITAGSLYIPGAETASNGFDVNFDPLMFDCLGRLTTMKLDGGPFSHDLDFWNARIRGIAAAFEPAVGAGCDPSDAYFTLGVQASASNIPQPLGGVLGFEPDGDLITADDGLLEDVDSRLSLPSSFQLAGPSGEQYTVFPLHNAYYDNHDHAADPGSEPGALNFMGLLDVAFFEDMPVHFQTAAQPSDNTSLIHMMGGWRDGGETFVSVDAFDLDHRGYPGGSDRTTYRAGGSGDLPTAEQHWLDVVEFSYPLQWSSSSRSFRSDAPKENKFLVVQTQNECLYLSNQVAELDFGASLRLDIPEINFANLAQGTPIYEALHDAADSLTETLVDGLARGEELLNDRMDEFYDDLFAATIDPPICALAADLRGFGDDAAAAEAAIEGEVAALASTIKSTLNPSGLPAMALTGIDDRLADVQAAIGALTGAGGFFAESGGSYGQAEDALVAVVAALSPDIDSNLDASGGYANLGAGFTERSGTIEQVKGTLDALQATIQAIRDDGFLAAEIDDAFDAAGAEIDTFMEEARDNIINELVGRDLSDFSEEELKDIIHNEIRDQFNASALFSGVQEILRGYLYELNAAMHEAIDSAFQQINRIINDLLDDFLPVDGALRGFLGDLAAVSFAGKIDGYARINGDALRTLRLDTEIQARLPDPFEFDGYLEINQLDSSGSQACANGTVGAVLVEVKMGAENVPVRWGGSELAFDIGTKFTFDDDESTKLRNMAGSFEMTKGKIDFEAMAVTELGAAAAFGIDENYLAAKVGIEFDGNDLYGGIFFGRTCTYDPLLLVDPNVAKVLPTPPLTGIYAYGEAEIPIFSAGCLFTLSASAGAGIFAFEEEGTVGGKMLLGATGRAICAVEVGGELILIGSKSGNDFSFFGQGRVFGSVGKKPLKIEFDKKVGVTFKNSKWDYDF